MKRLATALSILILLVIFYPGFSILAQPIHTPHENPATAKSSPDLTALLLSYSNVFDLAATGQYQDAQSLLKELKQTNIPDDLQYIIDRYNTLSRQLLTTLDKAESLLDEAPTLLSHNQTSDAKEKLDGAEATIRDVQFLLEDIEAATNTLSDRLGVFAAPAGSQIRQVHTRLEQSLDRPRQLINKSSQLQRSLTEKHRAQVQGELISTELSLSITPASVFVGENITASGRLTSDGNPLPNRKLTLLLDNEPLVTTTDLDGSYATVITIPYKYVSTMTLSTIYAASDYDIGTYLGRASSPVAVNIMFHPTLLEMSAPSTAYSGLPITISGQVSSTDGNIDRTIKVLLDNIQLAEEIIQGQFSLQITLPPQTSTGKHSLTVVATPQGRYSEASKSLTINISTQIPIQADIQVPQLVIIPKPIQISGKVSHNLAPVQDARVSLTFRQSSTTAKTATDGSFTTSIEAPLDLSLVGPQELTITVEPIELRYASLQIERSVLIINPANIGLLLVAFLSLGLLIYNRVRTRPAALPEEKVIPQPQAIKLPSVTPPPGPKYEFTGIKGRILSAYLSELEAVEKITSTPMTPHITLGEFLETAILRLPTAIKPFTELTTIAEVALYSAHRLDENIATRAEQLAATIKERLHNEPA